MRRSCPKRPSEHCHYVYPCCPTFSSPLYAAASLHVEACRRQAVKLSSLRRDSGFAAVEMPTTISTRHLPWLPTATLKNASMLLNSSGWSSPETLTLMIAEVGCV